MKNKLLAALAVLFALSLAACNTSDGGDTTTDTTALTDIGTVESTVQTETQSETETDTETETATETETVTETEEATTVHTHLYGEWSVISPPTCTKSGKMVRECECGDKEVEPLDELGHTEVLLEAIAPTCTKTGLAEGKRCATCKKTLVKQTVLPVLHDYSDNACSKCGEPTPSEGLQYNYNSKTSSYTVAGIGLCTDIDIVIAGSYNGKPVTGIEDYAFWHENIRSLVVGSGITSIGDYAFDGSYFMTDLTISSTVNQIGSYAFSNCKTLESITVDPDNKQYYSKDNCLIAKDTDTLLRGSISGIIPDGVRTIGDEAFAGIRDLNIPSSVTSISGKAFIECSGLNTITVSSDNQYYYSDGNCIIEKKTNTLTLGCKNSIIPEGVEKIGERAFWGCLGLESITIPDGVASIGSYAFYNCISLEEITIGKDVTMIDSIAFYACSSLSKVTFAVPDGWMAGSTSLFGLSDFNTAATYLKDTYYSYTWTRLLLVD
ncbi:MAG: hypothetical protein E7589_00200 [Ruminococcaceae bacterium]|nr:hypothetical protein [Oscillospiraceae bacterium]